MNIAFYNAYTAMQTYQKNLDNVSNNLANISTNGYKSARSDFDDLLYTRMDINDKNTTLKQGHGVKLANIRTSFEQGYLNQSNNLLDFAIIGQGFFASQNGENITYTRDGAFYIGKEDNNNYLVRQDGSYVLDTNMNPIILTYNDQGEVDVERLANQIGIFDFDNLDGLEKASSTSFVSTSNSGPAYRVDRDSVTLIQGAIEMSNVDMGEGMVALMEGQKAFQLNSRVIQTADQIEEIVNNLR